VNLQSEEYGKHLMGVEDLLQKHSIIESDIAIVGARVEAINTQAQTFVDADFPDVGGERQDCRVMWKQATLEDGLDFFMVENLM